MNIVFEDRPSSPVGFNAYVSNGALHLPIAFKAMCEEQRLESAEKFLAFAKKDPTTVVILAQTLNTFQLGDAIRSLEHLITNRPLLSEDLTPTSPVDVEAETPTAPGISPGAA
ncbi:MAG: hypothetical protein ABIO72_00085 [Patescibacteria group bacterium]